MCGQPEGNGVPGQLVVVGGRLLSQEAVRRSRGAQDGGDEAGGGMACADIMEVLGSRRCSLVRGERRWVVASDGGGRQLVVRGGRTRRRGARGVVKLVEERLERAVGDGARRAGRSSGEGP
jgi:hypothetical protein